MPTILPKKVKVFLIPPRAHPLFQSPLLNLKALKSRFDASIDLGKGVALFLFPQKGSKDLDNVRRGGPCHIMAQ
jgi:hypothetical protein